MHPAGVSQPVATIRSRWRSRRRRQSLRLKVEATEEEDRSGEFRRGLTVFGRNPNDEAAWADQFPGFEAQAKARIMFLYPIAKAVATATMCGRRGT